MARGSDDHGSPADNGTTGKQLREFPRHATRYFLLGRNSDPLTGRSAGQRIRRFFVLPSGRGRPALAARSGTLPVSRPTGFRVAKTGQLGTPVFPCRSGHFGRIYLGTDFGKTAPGTGAFPDIELGASARPSQSRSVKPPPMGSRGTPLVRPREKASQRCDPALLARPLAASSSVGERCCEVGDHLLERGSAHRLHQQHVCAARNL